MALTVTASLLLALGAVLLIKRRRALRRPETAPPDNTTDWNASRAAQIHREADRQGTELLRRRVALDMRRGTLGGDTNLDEALERLETKWREGTLSEEEFEAEKLRLLGG